MRCGCPHCEAFMIQSETDHQACVCPDCGYRCNACLGTGTVISKETLEKIKETFWIKPLFDGPLNDEEAEDRGERKNESDGSRPAYS